MRIGAQLPIFVPVEHIAELDRLSKGALIDMVWDYATREIGDESAGPDPVLENIRTLRETVLAYRRQALTDMAGAE